MMQHRDGDRQSSFKSDDAHGGALELNQLFVESVWSVIGGDSVDGTVHDAGDHGIAVSDRTKRWVHLVVRVKLAYVLIDEREMVRRDLRSGMNTGLLGLAHRIHCFSCRDVSDMNVCAGFAGQSDVTSDNVKLSRIRHAAQAETK